MSEFIVAEDEGASMVSGAVEEMYECSTCQVYFHSVMDHIRKYHDKQNVVIDMNEGTAEEEVQDQQVEEQENEEEIGSLQEEIEMEGEKEEEEQQQQTESSPPPPPPPTELIEQEEEEDDNLDETTYYVEYLSAEDSQIVNLKEIEKPPSQRKSPGKSSRSPKKSQLEYNNPSNQYQCDECGTFFGNNKSLRLHMKMHKPVHPKTLEQSIQHDMRGVKEDQEKAKKTFHCEECNKYLDEALLTIHMNMHRGEPTYNCQICNKKFENEENLLMHSKSHQDRSKYVKQSRKKDVPRPYSCQYCEKAFMRPHEKVKHERIHTGEKPHKCEVCGKCFRVAYCLTLHMRTHTSVRPYVCSICGHRFKAHSVYNHHLKTHSEERNYQCPFCPKAFKTAVQLSGHKNSHTKPFTCTECNRPFSSLFAVKTHMETHKRPNNGLRYRCNVCGAMYARNSSIEDHIKETHGNSDSFVCTEDLYTEIAQSTNTKQTVLLETLEPPLEGEVDEEDMLVWLP